jgi:hypothetical protein
VPKKSKNGQKKSEIVNESAPLSEAKADQIVPRRTPKAKKEGPKAKKPAPARSERPKAKPASARQPSDEEIRIRAYFISERRQRFALPGNASSDWLEATRQLLAEARPPRTTP